MNFENFFVYSNQPLQFQIIVQTNFNY